MLQSENELYQKAKQGDQDALNRLVEKHMPLVHTLSKRFSWQEDAFQAGCIGLVHAIRRFDLTHGVQFSTYAVPVILGEMRRAICGQESWRTKALLRKVRSARERYVQQYMREPSVQELADHIGYPPAELMLLLEQLRMKATAGQEEMLLAAPDPRGQAWMDKWMLRDMIQRLPESDRQLLQLRFVKGCNQKEVAQMLHTSQASVSRMENRVCRTLRTAWIDMCDPGP